MNPASALRPAFTWWSRFPARRRVALALALLAPLVLQRPLEAGTLELDLRSLRETAPGDGDWHCIEQRARWNSAGTAVVICDMWNQHWCQGATARVAEMAPRMNRVVASLRDRGVLIIHCPSDTMDFYRDHPGRRLAQNAPKTDLQNIKNACLDRVPTAETPLPFAAVGIFPADKAGPP